MPAESSLPPGSMGAVDCVHSAFVSSSRGSVFPAPSLLVHAARRKTLQARSVQSADGGLIRLVFLLPPLHFCLSALASTPLFCSSCFLLHAPTAKLGATCRWPVVPPRSWRWRVVDPTERISRRSPAPLPSPFLPSPQEGERQGGKIEGGMRGAAPWPTEGGGKSEEGFENELAAELAQGAGKFRPATRKEYLFSAHECEGCGMATSVVGCCALVCPAPRLAHTLHSAGKMNYWLGLVLGTFLQ
ncbi:unnamed protein product, partial [Prorocentrum cordatum]